MFYEPKKKNHGLSKNPFNSLVIPRPIGWISTVDKIGVFNLAPYSFFNAFSSNPPILVFSSNRTVANNTTKDTLHNVTLNQEVVVNVVNYEIVRQMSLASISYPAEINEFEKSGLWGWFDLVENHVKH